MVVIAILAMRSVNGVQLLPALVDFQYPLSVTINFDTIFETVDDVITGGLPPADIDYEEFYEVCKHTCTIDI